MSYLEELRAGKARNWEPECTITPNLSEYDIQKIKGQKALREVGVLEVYDLLRDFYTLRSRHRLDVHFFEQPNPEEGSFTSTMFFGDNNVSVKVTNSGEYLVEGKQTFKISSSELADDPELVTKALKSVINNPRHTVVLRSEPVVTHPPSIG